MVIPDPTSYEGSGGGRSSVTSTATVVARITLFTKLRPYTNKIISFMGPYAMVFSRSGYPSGDVSFFSQLGISGYVGANGRGTVIGTATGVSSSYQRVAH
ncbi:hypothetical protein FRC12_018090 [Ceratobasidium sp. 428]|nr:hypothetical protein FRC12_018090 [Ceratobasidium sp. 428]